LAGHCGVHAEAHRRPLLLLLLLLELLLLELLELRACARFMCDDVAVGAGGDCSGSDNDLAQSGSGSTAIPPPSRTWRSSALAAGAIAVRYLTSA
jgi:hypothetical protein